MREIPLLFSEPVYAETEADDDAPTQEKAKGTACCFLLICSMTSLSGLMSRHALHDELDAAVAEAYGWPAALEEQDVLRRLLELNLQSIDTDKISITSLLKPDLQEK